MFLPLSAIMAITLCLLLTLSKAQNPRRVGITSFPGSRTCTGTSRTRVVAINNRCNRYPPQAGVLSYRVDRDDDDCHVTSFSDNKCKARIARRELDADDDDDDSDCEQLPDRAKSFRVSCERDIDFFTDDDDDDDDDDD